jgi:hypothetical protein
MILRRRLYLTQSIHDPSSILNETVVNNPLCSLLKIPSDICWIIYDFLHIDQPVTIKIFLIQEPTVKSQRHTVRPLVQLLRVCRNIHREALSGLYGHTIFEARSSENVSIFLRCFKNPSQVQNVRFTQPAPLYQEIQHYASEFQHLDRIEWAFTFHEPHLPRSESLKEFTPPSATFQRRTFLSNTQQKGETQKVLSTILELSIMKYPA